MLDGLKRLFARGSRAAREWEGVQPWAAGKGYGFRAVPAAGFVVDGRWNGAVDLPWRLVWGPSQRRYIAGRELRLRCDLGVTSDLHAMVMNRTLQEQMEAAVFNQYVEGVQTRIDDHTPPEMRWLVMFPKLSGSEIGDLRERYVALCSKKAWLLRWLQGSLTLALASHRVNAAAPLVLMLSRGRLVLRTELSEAEVPDIERWLRLYEVAVREALRATAAFNLAQGEADVLRPSGEAAHPPGSGVGAQRLTAAEAEPTVAAKSVAAPV